MYRYALINKETNIVDNVTLWDGTNCWVPPDTHIAANAENMAVGPGYIHDNGTFTAPVLIETPLEPKPTLEQLQEQLLTITQQMAALANTANT